MPRRLAPWTILIALAPAALAADRTPDKPAREAAFHRAAASAQIAGYSLSRVQRRLHEKCLPSIDKATGLCRGEAGGIAVVLQADRAYEGKLEFDIPRHRLYMGFKKDWPRMNTGREAAAPGCAGWKGNVTGADSPRIRKEATMLKGKISRPTCLLALLGAAAVQATGAVPGPPGKEAPAGKVVLMQKIDVGDSGSSTGLRLGDLDGDGRLDIVLAQHRGQNITCVTAMDVAGKRLWRVGQPNRRHAHAGSDMPVQIYDIDQDGRNEVVYITDGKLKIADGKTGKLEAEGPLPTPRANDCIAFANFSGNRRPQDIVVKTRYTQVWALDRNLKVLWTHKGNTGHYCWPYDFDGDGRDELMCGFALLDHDGTKLWDAGKPPPGSAPAGGAALPGHSDAVAIGEVDGKADNGAEIALASCGGNVFALLGRDGKLRWKHPCGHAQHIILGDFRPDLPGKEVAALDRGNDRSARGVDAMVLYSCDGRQLWRERRTDSGRNRWLTMITTVNNWDGRRGDLILAHRRGGSTCPTLYDGHGRAVASFPFPHPEKQHFAQHADLFGDDREEIVVWNEEWIYVYANGAPYVGKTKPDRRKPNQRLYNYTAYIGMP